MVWIRYLKGIMAVGESQATGAAQALLPGALLPGWPAPGALQAQAQLAELFVSLLCRFEPELVLPFLQSNEAYRVQARHSRFYLQSHVCMLALPYIQHFR